MVADICAIDKPRQHDSSELQSIHPPHSVDVFSMSLSENDPNGEKALPCSRISDAESCARRRRRGEWAVGQSRNVDD